MHNPLTIENIKLLLKLGCLIYKKKKFENPLSTSSQISPSFQGDPTIFQKGIFLKQTPHIKN